MTTAVDMLSAPYTKSKHAAGGGKTKNRKRRRQQEEDKSNPKPNEDVVSPEPIHTAEAVEAKRMGFEISLPGILLINGRPGSGKSHLLRYVFYINRHKFRLGLVVSGTWHEAENLNFVPEGEEYRMRRYDSAKIRWLLTTQAAIPKEERKMAYFIADDYISDRNMWDDQYFQDMCTQCRHYDIFVCINTQYVNKVPPIIREAAFQTAVFKQDTKRSLQAAYESYGSGFETEKDFKRFNDQKLQKYEFLFIDKFHPEQQSAESHLIFQAPHAVPSFKLWDHKDLPPKKHQKGKKKKQLKKHKKSK